MESQEGSATPSSAPPKSQDDVDDVAVDEITLTCSDGIRLAAQRHRYDGCRAAREDGEVATGSATAETATKVLCLHGWMDNARSFHHLAPEIARNVGRRCDTNVEVVALDFPGHGLSDHKSLDGPLAVVTEYVYYVYEALQQLEWVPSSSSSSSSSSSGEQTDDEDRQQKLRNNVIIVAHSMGAATGLMYSSSFPEHPRMLVLLEGLGPLSRKPRDVTKYIRSHVQRRYAGNAVVKSKTRGARIYPSLAAAAEARCRTARASPGDQWLSLEASKIMVRRGTKPAGDVASRADKDGDDQPVQFRHDPRLQLPSAMYFSDEQVEAMYQDNKCPTAVFLAKHGWPVLSPTTTARASFKSSRAPSSSSSPNDGDEDAQEQQQEQQRLEEELARLVGGKEHRITKDAGTITSVDDPNRYARQSSFPRRSGNRPDRCQSRRRFHRGSAPK